MQKSAIPLCNSYNPGNYSIALALSRNNLSAADPAAMAYNSGCPYNPDSCSFEVNCLGHLFTVSYPDGLVKYGSTGLEPPVSIQLVMLNYLSRADGTPLSYQYVPYRALDGGGVFYDAFYRTAILPLAKNFGSCPQRLLAAGAHFDATPLTRGSGTGLLLFFLPRIPLYFQVWPGDEEFPAGANILFDSTANHYLHTEDLAAMSIVTRLLIKQSG
ncbi:MAG: DUF3786 domain-containing protein [Dethiobacter sp.]|jgi:hypothetical protein|nr:DUF3786 domain-containing protein [Dethiobacter sp.]